MGTQSPAYLTYGVEDFYSMLHTVVHWLICQHRDIGNSTYMKVILTKNLTFITIIYHTKFQLAKISGTMKKCNFLNFCDIYVPFMY